MSDLVRRHVPLAIAVALMVALTGGAALTQSDGQVSPAAKQKINVDKVDGKNAISATQNLNKRKGKLMAFNGSGYLPSNIVDGNVATVAALQSPAGAVNEADNPVNWNQIQNVPPAVLAGDTTRSFISQTSAVIPAGGTGAVVVTVPIGLEVQTTLIPVNNSGIFSTFEPAVNVGAEWFVKSATGTELSQIRFFRNLGAASAVRLRATVFNDSYISVSSAKAKVNVTFFKNAKKAIKKLRP